jgi:DnaJ-class molecular chaperone
VTSPYEPTPVDGEHDCEDCDGTGVVNEGTPDEDECQTCNGMGTVIE